MKVLRIISAVLLALPLLVFGDNYFLHLFPMPPGDGSAGDQLLQAMRTGGLMTPIAFSHVVAVGNAVAVALLLFNLGVVVDRQRLRSLLETKPSPA